MKSLHLKRFDPGYLPMNFSLRMNADAVLGFRVKKTRRKNLSFSKNALNLTNPPSYTVVLYRSSQAFELRLHGLKHVSLRALDKDAL